MHSFIKYFLTLFIAGYAPVLPLFAQIGTTTIAKWKDNKTGAYSLRFDDSMLSHKDHTIPNLVQRGLVGSFYLNPATERYGYGIDLWEKAQGKGSTTLSPEHERKSMVVTLL